jgi:hypothetical protein
MRASINKYMGNYSQAWSSVNEEKNYRERYFAKRSTLLLLTQEILLPYQAFVCIVPSSILPCPLTPSYAFSCPLTPYNRMLCNFLPNHCNFFHYPMDFVHIKHDISCALSMKQAYILHSIYAYDWR